MKKLNQLAVGLAVALGSTSLQAGTFSAVASQSISVEAAAAATVTATVPVNDIVLTTSDVILPNEVVNITLSSGTFSDGGYTLKASGSNSTGAFRTSVNGGALTFSSASTIPAGTVFTLQGSSAANVGGANTASVTIDVAALGAGSTVTMGSTHTNEPGTATYSTATPVTLFRYAKQFSAEIGADLFENEIDVESAGRKEFLEGTSDALTVDFTSANLDYQLPLAQANQTVTLTLVGNLSGVNALTVDRGDDITAPSSGTTLVTLATSEAFAANTANRTTTLNAVVGSNILSSGDFTIKGDLAIGSATYPLFATASAGSWDINGLVAEATGLSLGSTSKAITWFKIANQGTADAIVYADINYSSYSVDTGAPTVVGSVADVTLGTVKAGSVQTVSEAAILSAIADDGAAAGAYDVSVTFTVTGPKNDIFITSEKKDIVSGGRISNPVFVQGRADYNQ